MHGARSGAPNGKRNGAWRDGRHTNEAVAARRELAALNREWRDIQVLIDGDEV
jgi:hypothetical protein